jgi:FkbM family methyltransferase
MRLASYASTLPPNHVRIADIGALLGTFGLGVALQRRLGFLCLVEANSAVAPLLARNAERNHLAPTTVPEALVGWPGLNAAEGRSRPGNLGSMSFAGRGSMLNGGSSVAPPCNILTLTELLEKHGPFDLVKLDVEGMEHDILRGDEEFLSRGDTSIWVECNEKHLSLKNAEPMLRWGLELSYFAFPAHNPDNLNRDPIPIFPCAYEAGLLAAPRVRPKLDAELQSHGCILRSIQSVDDLKDALWRTPRWGMSEWHGAATSEVTALAGHMLRNETWMPIWSRVGSPVNY